ncbi:nucleotidyltransferase domain-containing protein [soil metagenome]
MEALLTPTSDIMILRAENIPNRELIRQVAERHGAQSVRVFGSFARGDARPDSDLDLLIEAGPETTPWFPGGIVADLEEALGRRVDVVTLKSLSPELRDRVLEESVPV